MASRLSWEKILKAEVMLTLLEARAPRESEAVCALVMVALPSGTPGSVARAVAALDAAPPDLQRHVYRVLKRTHIEVEVCERAIEAMLAEHACSSCAQAGAWASAGACTMR